MHSSLCESPFISCLLHLFAWKCCITGDAAPGNILSPLEDQQLLFGLHTAQDDLCLGATAGSAIQTLTEALTALQSAFLGEDGCGVTLLSQLLVPEEEKNNGIKGQPDDCSALVRVALLFKRSPKRKANLSKGAQEKHRMIRLHFSQHFWLWSLFCLETCLCSWCEIYTWHMRWIADPMISLSNNRCDSEIKNTYCTSISAFWMFFHVMCFRCSIWHGSGQPTIGYKRSLPRKQESWKQQKRTVLLFPHAQRVAICM